MDFRELFISFFKIGALSFGGGYAMIPFFEKEIAVHHWQNAVDYTKMIAVAQVLPGPFAINSSAYIGYKVAGICGGILASIALSLPSFIALVLISRFFNQFKSNKHLQLGLSSARPAVIGLLASAAYIIGFQPFMNLQLSSAIYPLIKGVLLVAAGVIILKYTRINTFLYIVIFGILGVILF